MDLRFRLVLPKRPMPSDITEELFLRGLNSPNPHFGADEFRSLPGYDVEREQFQPLLRSYVDQWIETGFYRDGREDLSERGVPKSEWYERGRLLPYAQDKIRVLETAPTLVLEAFRQKPQSSVSPEGIEITFPTYDPNMERAPLHGLAEREAKRFFVWFLASELRVKLGKCRACNRYEIKARKLYKNGTYCRRCKAKTSAGEITQKKRQDLQKKQMEALATILKSRSERIDLNDLAVRKRLAVEVNRRLKGEKRITSKWVKRNLRLVLP
jgi:hypothetical protein